MHKRYLLLSLLILIVGINLIAQDTIPCKLTPYNHISVNTLLNQWDSLTLMFHSAVQEVSLTTEATGRLQKLTFERADSLYSWGGTQAGRYSDHHSLSIGAFQFEDLRIWENKYSGQLTEGKFGPDLFGEKIIEIDPVQERICIHDHLPPLGEGFVQMKLRMEGPLMFLEGTLEIGDSSLTHQFLVHTGYGETLLLDDEFVQQHELGNKVAHISERELKDAYGNVIKTLKVKLPALSIAGERFQQVPIGFFDGAIGRQRMSVIGGELLKRFHILYDQSNGYAYMKPNILSRNPFQQK